MTVPATLRRAGPLLANGVTTSFPFTFRIFEEGDIRVVQTLSGVDTDLVLNVDYTVTVNADQPNNPGGSVDITPAPAAPKIYTVIGDLDYGQEVDLPDGGAYRAQQVEDGLDRVAIQVQQIQEIQNRVISFPPSSATGAELPDTATRANKFIAFDASGNLITSSGTGDTTLRADLASQATDLLGSGMVGFKATGTGAVERTILSKERERVSIFDFMSLTQIDNATDGTFAVDLTVPIQEAIDAVAGAGGLHGGLVVIPNGVKARIGNLTVKPAVSLTTLRSAYPDGIEGTNIMSYDGQLRTVAGTTITLNRGSNLNGLIIIPAAITTRQNAAAVAVWADTAVTTSTGVGSSITNCVIGGYNKCVLSAAGSRLKMSDCLIDGQNGVDISNSGDINPFVNVEAWPFMSQPAAVADNARTGVAFYVHDVVDWSKWVSCFCYGYATGFKITNANDTTLTNCGADNLAGGNPGAVGFDITGTSARTFLIGCQSAAHGLDAYRINSAAGTLTTMANCIGRAGQTNVVEIIGGDALLIGNSFTNTPTGVVISNAASRVTSRANRFNAITQEYSLTVASTLVSIKDDDYGDAPTDTKVIGVNSQVETIASAASVLLPANGEIFNISGTTQFGTLAGGWKGREVTLRFTGVLNLASNAVDMWNMDMRGYTGGDRIFTTTAGDVIAFRHDGTCWRMIGINSSNKMSKTVTAAGTTGAQTINKNSGTVNFAAAAASLVVTSNLVTTSSIIQATVGTNDATMKSVQAVAAAGSFTLYPNANPTAATRVNFTISN